MKRFFGISFTRRLTGLAGLFMIVGQLAGPARAGYVVTNLVSDIPGLAANTDPNLVNPWGITASPTSPFWISNNGSGVSTLYTNSGGAVPLVVTVPAAPGGTPPGSPTGIVFNGGSGFDVAGGAPARFIFATEDGTIAGWNPGANLHNAIREVAIPNAVYKGLAIGNNGSSDHLYATNFRTGGIDVFDSKFAHVNLSGTFTDPILPAGFAPFGIQNIGNTLFVTYALQNAEKHDDVGGAGNGFVDEFDLNGNFLKRLVSNGALDSPWGLALAPNHFGQFSNDLLVGNLRDGLIHAFDPNSGALLGTLSDNQGQPIANVGLWGLFFRNTSGGSSPDSTLFFTAGIGDGGPTESHGLFGSISVPEPGSLMLLGLGVLVLGGRRAISRFCKRQ